MSLKVNPPPTSRRRRLSLIPTTIAPSISIKCVIAGDKEIGKTCFLNSYVNPTHQIEKEYIPTVFDTFSVTKERNGPQLNLGLYDTSGGDENKVMRLDTYPQTNVFIVAFSIDNIESFENVKTKWLKEIKHFGSFGGRNDVPVLLVGMKSDTRNISAIQGKAKNILGHNEILNLEDFKNYSFASTASRRQQSTPSRRVTPRQRSKEEIKKAKKKTVTISQGITLCKEIDAESYMECSSSNKTGVEEIFQEVIRLGIDKHQKG